MHLNWFTKEWDALQFFYLFHIRKLPSVAETFDTGHSKKDEMEQLQLATSVAPKTHTGFSIMQINLGLSMRQYRKIAINLSKSSLLRR